MGTTRPLWAWEQTPLEVSQKLKALEPDRSPGIRAAADYLESRAAEIVRLRTSTVTPILFAVLMLAAAVIGVVVMGR